MRSEGRSEIISLVLIIDRIMYTVGMLERKRAGAGAGARVGGESVCLDGIC